MTLVSSFNKTFETYSNKAAIEFDDKNITFNDVNKNANRIANVLKSLSVNKHDRVAMFLANSMELIFSFAGILKNGSIVVPMNTFFKEEEAKYMLNDSGAKAIILDNERLPIIKNILPELKELKYIIVSGNNPDNSKKNSGKKNNQL